MVPRSAVLALGFALAAGGAQAQGCTTPATPADWAQATLATIAPCLSGDWLAVRSAAGETRLHPAAAHARDPQVVEALLAPALAGSRAAGIDPTLTRRDGQTALHRAAAEGAEPAVVALLALYGAEVDAMFDLEKTLFPLPQTRGTTPLHLAAARPDAAAMVAALLAAGAEPRARDPRGRTALHLAAQALEDTRNLDLLLVAGADPDADDLEGWTPLHMAAGRCDGTAVVRRLLQTGADPDEENAADPAHTPLRLAAARATDPACFALLVEASRDPCAAAEGGGTAQEYAARNRSLDNTPVYWTLHDRCRRTR